MVTRLSWRQFAMLALVGGVVGCGELEVINSNAPERERAFSDPATIIAAAGGTIKTYINMRNDYDPSLTLANVGDAGFTASWNNFNMRYYGSYAPTGGANCLDRCGWFNVEGDQLGDQIKNYWYGSYSMLSSANDGLFALRVAAEKPDLCGGGDPEATCPAKQETEVIAQMAQAMAIAWVALNYDQGFIVLEDSDLTTLQVESREALRDKAIELFETGISLAQAADFETSASVFGIGGPTYTNGQIAKAMRTMQAELLAHFPRNTDENAQVNWAKVAEYASKGVSANDANGAPFDFNAYVDENLTFFSGYLQWGNLANTVRVDTRVARLLSTTQLDPWPGGAGSPRPADAAGNPIGGLYGVDLRLGNGCFSAGARRSSIRGQGECVDTLPDGTFDPRRGTDFGHATRANMNPARGQYHQSNLYYMRHHCLALGYPDCPTGAGDLPLLDRAFNDLLWAEGLLRSSGAVSQVAVDLINNTREGRGGLPGCTVNGCPTVPPSGGTPWEQVMKAMLYEQEIELMQFAGTQYFNRRRVSKTTSSPSTIPNLYTADGVMHLMDPEDPDYVLNSLWRDAPRQFPVPAKDLALLLQEIYSCGGSVTHAGGQTDPTGMCVRPSAVSASNVRSVREIYAELQQRSRSRLLWNRPH